MFVTILERAPGEPNLHYRDNTARRQRQRVDALQELHGMCAVTWKGDIARIHAANWYWK